MYRAILALGVGLAGCAGDEGGKDTGAGTADTGGDPSAATFTRVKAEILTPSCAISGCHAAGTTINGMELVVGGEHAALVDAASIGKPGETLVIPGNSDTSYVVLKLEDAVGIAGYPMPSPFGGLDGELIQLMRDWIDDGALDN